MTGAVKEHLDLLVSLQEKDSAIDHLKIQVAELTAQVATQKELLAAEKNRLAVAHERGKQIQLAKKAKELEVAEKEASIKKHQNELNAVKSNDAFKALLSEIDRAKGEISQIEDGILQLMEELDGVARAEKEEQVLIKKVEAETATKVAGIERERAALEEKGKAIAAERAQTAAQVPPALLAKYDAIRVRRKGVAVVPAQKDGCGGCHMALPPQLQVEVRKGGALTTCPSCTRILFVPAAPAAPTA